MHRMKPLSNRRCDKTRSQHINNGVGNDATPGLIPLLAYRNRYVEEQGLHFAIVKAPHRDVGPPVPQRQMRRIHVRDGSLQQQPAAKQIAHGRKDLAMNRLISRVVNQ